MRAYVYQVTNKVNGKIYIGLTRFNVTTRWAQHVQNAKRGLKTYLYSAIAKYGIENFAAETIATCIDAKDAWLVEREVIADRKPDYNMTNGGEFTVGKRVARDVVERIKAANKGQKRTAETRAKQSLRKKQQIAENPEYRARIAASLSKARANMDRQKQRQAASKASRGRIWSVESRAKLSASCMGRRYGADVLARMAQSKRKRVECVSLATVFDSLLDAAEGTGVYFSNISRVCRAKCGTAGGLVFQFVE